MQLVMTNLLKTIVCRNRYASEILSMNKKIFVIILICIGLIGNFQLTGK